MHAPDSADTVGGMFVATPNKSKIGRHIMNALAREAINAVLRSGQSLFGSGALDAAASTPWIQLANSIAELEDDGDLKTVTLRAACGSGTADVSATYVRHALRKVTTLFVPTLEVSVGGSPASTWQLRLSPDSDIPADLRPMGSGSFATAFPVFCIDDAVAAGSFLRLSWSHSTNRFIASRSPDFEGSLVVPGFHLTFVTA